MEIIIEKAGSHEAETLVNIYRDAYAENESLGLPACASKVTVKEVQDWINNTILLTAKEKQTNTIVATVRFKYSEEWQCYVHSRLAVNSLNKGRGLATKLMKHGECMLSEMNEKVVRLTVAQTHPYLPKMYEKKGYKIVGERLLNNLPYNEFIMEKIL
ncbi:GNAT family N-acetyltransferase [Bacillus sp. S/N-304-OC-R1]|uniref:GNAT family N-acetyltransferase n=1 Tax=Bacillus sp. S/N-304-OC-R1 TaxID=2758034 RepID=UPI001C8D35BD|nr:GNAT family N-acetyltransferase [Bacillus sp. S/N-304-OC-R1]MBY0121659.1 GNAT family N-acetyltransferase [Bacillus sp. S/N-304-OC-R1]